MSNHMDLHHKELIRDFNGQNVPKKLHSSKTKFKVLVEFAQPGVKLKVHWTAVTSSSNSCSASSPAMVG